MGLHGVYNWSGRNGLSYSCRYFFVTIGLGTPSRNFSLIIDTGSSITYVPCQGCKHCGKHKVGFNVCGCCQSQGGKKETSVHLDNSVFLLQDKAFNMKESKTAVSLKCGEPLCNCGSPSCQCVDSKCYYSRTYAERSSSSGILIQDCFAFPDAKEAVKLVFGCESDETGEIYKQDADGLLGMGNSNNAFQSQVR